MMQSQLRIVKEITSRIAVSRIYQIGHRQYAQTYDGMYQHTKQAREHFDLLVVVDGICNKKAFSVEKTINSNSAIGASVSLWLHSGASIEESLYDNRNGHFFHVVLTSGKLIYQMPDDPEFDNVLDPDLLNTKTGFGSELESELDRSWSCGYNKAKALLNAASNMDENDAEAVKLWLLHQTMKQLCLAFIFKMIGYKPTQHSLAHLFSICRCITPVIDEVFPTATNLDRSLFTMLTRSGRKLRYYSCKDYDSLKVNMLHQRCADWIEKAKELTMRAERIPIGKNIPCTETREKPYMWSTSG